MKFEIYPKATIPRWVKKGAWCHCLGEASDKYHIVTVDRKCCRVWLQTWGEKLDHGWESITKIYQDMSEWEKRNKK